MTRLLPNRVALYAFILTLTGGLTACHQAVAPTEEELVGSCEQAVRITARVSPFGGAPAGTRADVTGTVGNEKTDPWQRETKDPAQYGEVRLSRLYVFITKRGSDKIEKTLYYYAEDYTVGDEVEEDGKLKGTEIPASQLTTTESGEVTMDMTLLPGDYSFVLVANSPEITDIVKSPEPLTLSHLNAVFSMSNSFVAKAGSDDFGAYDYGFPIIGYRDLTVPSTTQPDKRVELQPVIPMERLEARVDVTLTTATNDKRTDYVSYMDGERFDPSQYKLTQFVVLLCVDVSDTQDETLYPNKKLYPYTLFPVEGEFTALPNGTPRYPLASYSPPEILDDDGFQGPKRNPVHVLGHVFSDKMFRDRLWPKYVNNGDAGQLGRLWRQSVVFMPTSGPGYIYLPAVYFGNVTDKDKDKDKVVRLQLKFTKLDGTETLTYRIPIHNETGAPDYYSIRRNTIYDIDLTFYGSKLVVKQSNAEYNVDTWEDQPVDIPW